MNKNHLKFTCFTFLLSLLAIGIWSCTKDEAAPLAGAQGSPTEVVSMTDVVRHILAKGYELDDIKEYDTYYLVKGDLVFSKGPESPAIGANQKNFHSNHLVSSTYIGNGNVIRVFSELPGPTGFGTVGNTWDEAVDEAIAAWNGIPDACVIFQRTTVASLADIRVTDGFVRPLGATMFGWAGTPSAAGAPFHTVWINMQYPNGPAQSGAPIANTTMVQKRNIIAHELGHCIGLEHSNLTNGNAIPGTGGYDANSIMHDNLAFINNSNVFSAFDKIAVRWLYGSGNCVRNDPGPNPVQLNSIKPFCFPATFSVSGSYLNQIGQVTIELQVQENTGGLSAYQTIATGQFNNGTFFFTNVDLGNIPGFTFNPSNPYNIRAVMTSPSSASSAIQNLPYNDCSSDPCDGHCESLQNVIQMTTVGIGNNHHSFSIDPSVLNNSCSDTYTYEWQHSQSNSYFTGPTFNIYLPSGSHTVAMYVIKNGGKCYKETIHFTVL